jgi:NAD(P)-dependent dehydrogenase (short-subunit alcohol dehydrogenase family)
VSRITLEGQVAIVTGSGAGLGRAYALDLAARGAAVVVNDFVQERADAVVAEIEAAGGRAAPSYDSVVDRKGARAIVDVAVERFGTVDAVVNNAGNMRNGWFEELTVEDFDSLIGVHVGGCFHVSQAAWPILREKGYGRVVMISSNAGLWAMQGLANYAAAKGAVYALGRALAVEGRELGILVNNVLPGAATEIAAGSPVPGYEQSFRKELRDVFSPRRAAESVAPLVTYLASRACEVTGETYSAVAGRYARAIVAIADGWFVDDHLSVTAEDIAEHFDEINDASSFNVPFDLFDEYETIAERLGVSPAVRR